MDPGGGTEEAVDGEEGHTVEEDTMGMEVIMDLIMVVMDLVEGAEEVEEGWEEEWEVEEGWEEAVVEGWEVVEEAEEWEVAVVEEVDIVKHIRIMF
jgi:hypothetical protein